MTHAAIYARISLDRHDGEGVDRQLADCRDVVAARGWTGIEYVDNDLSAYRSKRRPAWEQLLEDLRARRIGAVVAYHPDRLYRRLVDLEDLIDAIETAGAAVVTIQAGDIDLTTATGRMQARIIAAVARHESERMGERVSRAKRGRASQGRPHAGGRRPFGLTADRLSLEPDEAEQIRLTAQAVSLGGGWGEQARRMTALGFTTTAGSMMTAPGLRRIVTSPHVAGLRTYKGEIVAETITPPIIDRDLWDAVRLIVKGNQRTGRPPVDRFLLTGLIRCGACGLRMYGSGTRGVATAYQCKPGPTTQGTGCGRSVSSTLDDLVVERVGEWVANPDLEQLIASSAAPQSDASNEVAELERRRNLAAARWGHGEITDDEYEAARVPLTAKIDRLRAGTTRAWSLDSATIAGLRAGWKGATVPERRSVISALAVTPLVILPGRDQQGQRVPLEDRLDLVPRWEDVT